MFSLISYITGQSRTGYMQQDSSDKSRCSSRIGYLYYYSSPVGKNMSSKFDEFLAARSQYSTAIIASIFYAHTCCQSATSGPLAPQRGTGQRPGAKKYVSKYFHGFFITINSMILYFKHIIHIDDFPVNGQPLSIYYYCLLSVITHPSRCVWLNSVSICLTNTLFAHRSLPIFTS